MAYTQAFQIPVNKDWVFRGKNSQQELLESTPGVERIHVADRSTAKPTTAGYDVVKVTIRGVNAKVVKELFEEGRQKILASLAYDAEKAEKKRIQKQRRADKRFHQKEKELYEKHAPMADRHQQSDAPMMVQVAERAISKFENGNSTSIAKQKADQTATRRNGFGLLEVEDVQAKANLRKMARQNATNHVPSPQTTRKPTLSGWAKMASKAPTAPAAPKTFEVTPVIIHKPVKKVSKPVPEVWNSVEEGQTTGWDADW